MPGSIIRQAVGELTLKGKKGKALADALAAALKPEVIVKKKASKPSAKKA